MIQLTWLNTDDLWFPPVSEALVNPDGLLAAGGDLSPTRLITAYRQGIFPWYSKEQPILWWSPDPRTILLPEELKVSRSLRKTLRKRPFRISFDQAFEEVLVGCAGARKYTSETWLTPEMMEAYLKLHKVGIAHSAEAWNSEGQLAGGLYGVAIGRVFFGESMFARQTDASKVAFVHLVRQLQAWGYRLIDCQVYSNHLASLGAREIPRAEFLRLLRQYIDQPGQPTPWQLSWQYPA